MDNAITGHTHSEGGALAPPSLLFRLGNPGLANLLVEGSDAAVRFRVAREFHEAGRLRRGPFVATSARAEDWTSVFFRALSGEVRVGSLCPLRDAEGGTLFLDEIEALDRDAQRLMLEFLNHGRATGARDRGWAGLIEVGSADDLGWRAARGEFLPALYDSLDKIRVNLSLVA